MGCSEVFQGNENGAKHPHNVTSHIGFPRNVSEKIWPGAEKYKNVAKTAKIEGYTRFGLSRGPMSSERHGIPHRDMGGPWKGLMWLGTSMWMPLYSLRDNFGFHEKWTNGVFRNFLRELPINVTSHVVYPRNVSRVNMTRLEEVQKFPKKQPKLKVISSKN